MADEITGLSKEERALIQWVVNQVRAGRFGQPFEQDDDRRPRPVVWIGKPATTFAEGALTSPNNVINLWLGPAHGVDSAATGDTIDADYSTGAFGTSDFVTVTTAKDGKKYVTCFPSGS